MEVQHEPKYLRRLFCAGLAAVKNLRDLDVMTQEPFCQPLNIGSTLITQWAIRVDVFW